MEYKVCRYLFAFLSEPIPSLQSHAPLFPAYRNTSVEKLKRQVYRKGCRISGRQILIFYKLKFFIESYNFEDVDDEGVRSVLCGSRTYLPTNQAI